MKFIGFCFLVLLLSIILTPFISAGFLVREGTPEDLYWATGILFQLSNILLLWAMRGFPVSMLCLNDGAFFTPLLICSIIAGEAALFHLNLIDKNVFALSVALTLTLGTAAITYPLIRSKMQ